MNFVETLKRILLLLEGQVAPLPEVGVSTTQPEPFDSKEVLALKWEKALRV
jgi:hypothetical protein